MSTTGVHLGYETREGREKAPLACLARSVKPQYVVQGQKLRVSQVVTAAWFVAASFLGFFISPPQREQFLPLLPLFGVGR